MEKYEIFEIRLSGESGDAQDYKQRIRYAAERRQRITGKGSSSEKCMK